MNNLSRIIIVFLIVVLLLSACGGAGGGSEVNIVGKWTGSEGELCMALRGAKKVEFFKDQTAVIYDIIGSREVTGLSGNYNILDDKRVKIDWQGGRFTDIVEYSISGNTLNLCQSGECCDLQRE